MKRGVIFIMLLFVVLLQKANGQDIERNILFISGASSMEEVGVEVMERFYGLRMRPIDINSCSKSRLLSSGLFTKYQVASLLDYKYNNGEVLSLNELALIDGFGHEFAKAVKPFIIIRSSSLPVGHLPTGGKISNYILAKCGFRSKEASYGVKYKINVNDRWESGVVAKINYGERLLPPSMYGGHISFFGKKLPGKIILGDFNAKFGQGLCLWNGFSISGLNNLRSIMRAGTGVLPSVSFSDSNFRGLALDVGFGRFTFTALSAMPGLKNMTPGVKKAEPGILPAFSLSYIGRYGEVSLNGASHIKDKRFAFARLSIDSRACFRGIDVFAEAMFDMISKKSSAIGGTIFPLGENLLFAASARYLSIGAGKLFNSPLHSFPFKNGEIAATFGIKFKNLQINTEYADNQTNAKKMYKFFLSDLWLLSETMSVATRMTGRVNFPDRKGRYGARFDMKWAKSVFSANFRLETVLADRRLGGLSYCEAGIKDAKKALYLRSTFFIADSWACRIYSYERDAPGSFSVPVYYGRGFSISVFSNLKLRINRDVLKLYLRGSIISYPWSINRKKPSRAELKLQLIYNL